MRKEPKIRPFFCIFSLVKESVSIAKYKAVLAEKEAQIAQLTSRLAYFERMLFGRKSERFVAEPAVTEQLNMFATDDAPATQSPGEPLREKISYERNKPVANKKHPGRTPLPEHFKVEERTLEPQEDTTGMTRIGEHISELRGIHTRFDEGHPHYSAKVCPPTGYPRRRDRTGVVCAATCTSHRQEYCLCQPAGSHHYEQVHRPSAFLPSNPAF